MYAFEMAKQLPVIDLHLFDNGNTNVTTDAGMSAEMKTYYHDRLIDFAEPKLVYSQFGQKAPIPRNRGKNVEFRKYSPLPKATTALTEGVTPRGRKLEVSTVTAQAYQYGDYIEVSDVLEMTAIDRNLEQATKMQGGQSGRTLDTVVREVVCASTNKMFQPAVGADGTKTEILLREEVSADSCWLRMDTLKVAAGKLKRMNTEPVDEDFVAIVHTDTTTDIMRDDDWVEVHKYARPENIYNGEIGRIGNIRFVETTEGKIIGPGWIFGDENVGGVCRMTLAASVSAGKSITLLEGVTAAQAAELTERISKNGPVPIYVGGAETAITAVAQGDPGAATFTLETAVTATEGAMVCGYGAGADGSAIYCTMIIGANAYGTTEVQGLGLEHIIKQLGSAGTGDPLNQRATTGWKATSAAVRLVEEYMVRIEHSSRTFGKMAVSN